MKSLTKIVFLFAVVIAPVLFVPIPASAGLVPCGTAEHPEACTLCHILVGGQGIITWGMGIMVIVGLALIMIAGVVYIISVGDNGRMTTAKGIIEKAIGGLALILCGWLIVNTIIGLLANDTMGIGIQKTNWYTFKCDSKSSANTGGGDQNNNSGINGGTTTITPPGGTTGNSSDVVVSIPSTTPVVTTVPSGSTRHVALHGSPDFSLGSIAVESVVQVAAVSGDNFFSSIGVPVAYASGAGLTITPTTITTLEEWREGLTLTVEADMSDKNVYTVTLKQRNAVLGTIRVGVASPAAGNAMNNNNANDGAGSHGSWLGIPKDETMHPVAPSTPIGTVMNLDGKPIKEAVVYCGYNKQDKRPPLFYSNSEGLVKISKMECDLKAPDGDAKVWVVCPDGLTAVPGEIPLSEFNGSTFTCRPTGLGVPDNANTAVKNDPIVQQPSVKYFSDSTFEGVAWVRDNLVRNQMTGQEKQIGSKCTSDNVFYTSSDGGKVTGKDAYPLCGNDYCIEMRKYLQKCF